MQMPDQNSKDERFHFKTDNGRVEDPFQLLEEEDALRPWTAEEKRIFMDKFLAFPKVPFTLSS